MRGRTGQSPCSSLFIRWEVRILAERQMFGAKSNRTVQATRNLRPCRSRGRSVVHMLRLKEHNARGKWSLILLSAAAPRNLAKTRIGRCGSSSRSPAQLRLSDKAHRKLRCIDVLRRPSTWQHALSLYVGLIMPDSASFRTCIIARATELKIFHAALCSPAYSSWHHLPALPSVVFLDAELEIKVLLAPFIGSYVQEHMVSTRGKAEVLVMCSALVGMIDSRRSQL